MRGKKLQGRLVFALAALVFAAAAAAVPFAWSRYVAAGEVVASGRVAAFAPDVVLGPGWPTTAENKYVLQNHNIGLTSYSGLTFDLINTFGETMINFTPTLVNRAGIAYPHVTFEIDGSNTPASSFNLSPGQTETIRMRINYNSGLTVWTETYWAELRVNVVQVD